MDSLETRELTYFIAVADALHFGRAAERLGIAQPPLSRSIARLERRLGVRLFDRTSRSVSLTAAGHVLRHEGTAALQAMAAAAHRTQRAGNPEPRIVLVMKAGGDAGLLPDILAAYQTEPDAVPVEVDLCTTDERAARLQDGRADVGLLHYPNNDFTGLDFESLLAEQQVAVLSAQHRLGDRASVRMADLEGEPMPNWPGSPGGSGPEIHDSGQLMQLIALNRLVAVLPSSVVGQLRRDLAYVPVSDAPATTLVVAWPENSRSQAVADFVRSATVVARRTTSPMTPTDRDSPARALRT